MERIARALVLVLGVSGSGCGVDTTSVETAQSALSNGTKFSNSSGESQTFNPNNGTDESNEFFQSLGTNGRRCVTCHGAGDGWSVQPATLQSRFTATNGTDPIFRTNDGSTSPTADVSTLAARQTAYAMLLSKGVIRVGLAIPAGAEFELIAVDDPYRFASASELSLFRRPLPSANLQLTKTVMWDGRETFVEQDLQFDLRDQANGATVGHAQATGPLTDPVRQSIVDLEIDLFNAQSKDNNAHELDAAGARGGPSDLATEVFDPATNVPGFDIYAAWADQPGGGANAARRAIARGEAEFNKIRPAGRCTGCHSVHNVGSSITGAFFDIGVSDAAQRTPDMPLYTLRNLGTGEIKQTSDPGRALITGLWRDINRFKAPSLRGLAARAPYFHNGSAATLDVVVSRYEARFGFVLTAQEQSDLVAFLGSL